jgi:hypothetical protein
MIKPRVPGGCQVLGPISLVNIHLHAIYAKWTAGLWTLPITVIISVGVGMVRTDGVEVVVDTPFRTPVVHIEFDISAKEVERSFSGDTTATIYCPTSAIPISSLPHP